MKAVFVNLTNGINLLDSYSDILQVDKISFIRIQSTWCEQKRWNDILMTISDDFLMKLALGFECYVLDTSPKREVPRAIWQGLEFIKFVLYKIWFSKDYTPIDIGRCSKNCKPYFERAFNDLSNAVIKRIEYYKKFLLVDKLNVYSITMQNNLDGNYAEFRNILIKKIDREAVKEEQTSLERLVEAFEESK